MSGGLSEEVQKLSGPSISSDLGFMEVTFTGWPLEETELQTEGMERMVELFSTMSWLCFSFLLCSHFLCLALSLTLSFSLLPLSLTQYLSLSSHISRHPPSHTHTHTLHTTQECVCWPITQGNFFSFLRGFHQSPTTLAGRVDLIVSEIPLYSS